MNRRASDRLESQLLAELHLGFALAGQSYSADETSTDLLLRMLELGTIGFRFANRDQIDRCMSAIINTRRDRT